MEHEENSYKRVLTIMTHGWLEKVADLYTETFPWQIRFALAKWLGQDDSFMSWNTHEARHKEYIRAFMKGLVHELQDIWNPDLAGQQDGSNRMQTFIFCETLSKLGKRVVIGQAENPIKLFREVKNVLQAEKDRVEELIRNKHFVPLQKAGTSRSFQ